MTKQKIAYVLLPILLLLCGCASRAQPWPQKVEDSFWIPRGAQIEDRSHHGWYRVTYKAHVCYPAKDLIDDMVSTMTGKGWRRLEYGPLNPSVPLSSKLGEWNRGLDKNYRLGYGWTEVWEDSDGNIIDYQLTYWPKDQSGITTEDCLVHGRSLYTSKEALRAILEKIKEIEAKERP